MGSASGESDGDVYPEREPPDGIPPDEPIGIPSDQPQRWMMVGMAIQEGGTEGLDYFAMMRGWGMCRQA